MAYDTKKLYEQAIEAITANKLFFIEDLVAYLPCTKDTFYKQFPLKSYESDNIKALLEENIIKAKQGLKAKWYKSDNPSMSISLYKLLGTPEERQKLSQAHLDIKSDGDKITGINYVVPEKKEGE